MGVSLSLYHQAPLLLDIRDCVRSHNGFELEQVFSFPVQLAQPEDVRDVLGWQSTSSFRYIMAKPVLKFLRNRRFVLEPHFHYWPDIRHVTLPCYFKGYWQSARYFKDGDQTIRDLFAFRPFLSDRNHEIARTMGAVNSVSLHVRRGDYADNFMNLLKHGLCPLNYYEAAIQYITKHVKNPLFFIFSDDIDWVRENLKVKSDIHFIDHNRGMESYNDMRLMSLCKHHIIANSSFSWWSAWLNPDKEKIVIAPQRWFANYPVRTSDLIPRRWVQL